MACKQLQTDTNPASPTYQDTRIISVPCPPNIPCGSLATCSFTVSCNLLCIPEGIRITVIVSGASSLFYSYSLNNETYQQSNVFIVSALPPQGYIVKVYDRENICLKQINTGYLQCNQAELLPQSVLIRSYINNYYCPDNETVFAYEIVNVYLSNGVEYDVIVDRIGVGSC